MMGQIGKVTALCLVGMVFAVLLKKRGAEMGLLLTLAVVAVAGTVLMQTAGQALSMLERFIALGAFDTALFRPLIKTTGIAVVSRLGSDLCRDAGEGAMASLVEMTGSFSAILVALPLFETVWEMLQAML